MANIMSEIWGYKIRRKSDGKFSTGGVTPKFNSVGKTWSSRGNLNGHLTMVRDTLSCRLTEDEKAYRFKGIYGDCEIITLAEVQRLPICS